MDSSGDIERGGWARAGSRPGARGGPATPVLLIVDPDASARRRVARCVAGRAIARTAADLEAARRLLREHPLGAVVTEVDLGRASGLVLLDELASQTPRRPALVVSGTEDVLCIRRACLLGASFVSKREPEAVVRRCVGELIDKATQRPRAAESVVDRVCRRAGLTRAEREAVLAFVLTNDRAALGERLGIAETSVRSRVRGACRKLAIAHLHEVFRILFDQALAT